MAIDLQYIYDKNKCNIAQAHPPNPQRSIPIKESNDFPPLRINKAKV